MKQNQNSDQRAKWQIIILTLVSLGLTVMYVSLCFNRNIWTDEAFTVDMLNRYKTFREIAAYTATDVHPPLYYWMLKCFTLVFGNTWTIIKIFSVIPMVLLFGMGIFYVRKRFGFCASFLFILMIAAIPCSMEYAVQMRMYSWSMFFVTGAGFAAIDAWETENKRSYLILGLCGVGAAYSHYFAFVAILWIYGILFLSLVAGRRKRALLFYGVTVLCSVIAYVPWIPYFIKQISGVSKSYWIPEITGDVIKDYFSWIFASDIPGVVRMCQILYAIAIVVLVFCLVKRHHTEDMIALCAIMIPLLVVLTGICLSKIIRPIFIIRYVMPAIPLLCFFFAIMMSGLTKYIYWVLCLFLGILIGVDYRCTYYDEYLATDTEKTMEFLEENAGEQDLIAYNYSVYDFVYQCYFEEEKVCYIQNIDFTTEQNKIWFLCTVYQAMPDQNVLDQNGWTMTYIGDFGIEQNEFWIYELNREQENEE